jgi:hypothetical protein
MAREKKVDFQVHIGRHLKSRREIHQSLSERSRHVAIFGQTGGGKSEAVKYQVRQILRSGHGLLFMDPHGVSAQAVLDDVIRAGPRVAERTLYISTRYPEHTGMIDLFERMAETQVSNLLEREMLAKEFSQILVRTSDSGGRDATAGMVRFMNNVTMAIKALYDADEPFASIPMLFNGPSMWLDRILAKTDDPMVVSHFRKLSGMRDVDREKYTESIVNRIHQLFSSIMLRTMLSGKGGISISELLRRRSIVILDLGPAEGATAEHSRLIESILLNAYFRAAQRRFDEKGMGESPCHVVIEEAATIISRAEIEFLAQARKYGLCFSLIFQGLEGLRTHDADLVDGVLSNSGTKIVFRQGNDQDAKRLADIMYAAQINPTKVIDYRPRTSQRVSGHREVDTWSMNNGKSQRGYEYDNMTESSSTTRGSTFLPEYTEVTEYDKVYLSTNDQSKLAAAALLNLQVGQFVLQTPTERVPRLCYSPLPSDPYRMMPGIREKRRREFLNDLFSRWPYRMTEEVLDEFQNRDDSLGLPEDQNDSHDDSLFA